jgi:hypothetical protein
MMQAAPANTASIFRQMAEVHVGAAFTPDDVLYPANVARAERELAGFVQDGVEAGVPLAYAIQSVKTALKID